MGSVHENPGRFAPGKLGIEGVILDGTSGWGGDTRLM